MNFNGASVFVIGESGQLAQSFAHLNLKNLTFSGHREIDLNNEATLCKNLERKWQHRPFQILINTAAYTNVDMAENNREIAMQINGTSVGVLSAWCKAKNIFLVHYSTDYIFSGDGAHAWDESSQPQPVNYYGQTKLLGEQKMLASGVSGLILRTSWVHSPYGVNFVKKMLSLNKAQLRIVADQVGSPTYAPHLAAVTIKILDSIWKTFVTTGHWPRQVEIFHATNHGYISWYDFACAIFARAFELEMISIQPQVIPIPTVEYKTPARRPLNSRLSCEKLKEAIGEQMPYWQEGLDECLLALKTNQRSW